VTAAADAVLLCCLVLLWALMGWMFNPAQQQRLLTAAGPRGPVVISLNSSAIYAGQALGGVLGGLTVAHGPSVEALAAVCCVLLSVLTLVGSTRFGRQRPNGPVAASAEPERAASGRAGQPD
jgi:DHA1 family inner membrane transport protein